MHLYPADDLAASAGRHICVPMLLLPGRAGPAGVGIATRQLRRIQLIACTDQPPRQVFSASAEPIRGLTIVDRFYETDPACALGDLQRAIRIPRSRAAHPSPRGRDQILADTVRKTRLDKPFDRLRHERRRLAPDLVREPLGQLL